VPVDVKFREVACHAGQGAQRLASTHVQRARGHCSTKYDVTFPLFSKIVVKGPAQHPLYAALTAAQPSALGLPGSDFRAKLVAHGIDVGAPEDITWNFEKFLIDRRGNVVARFAPDVTPDAELLVTAVERELAR
jgi:glutathione peroxidase